MTETEVKERIAQVNRTRRAQAQQYEQTKPELAAHLLRLAAYEPMLAVPVDSPHSAEMMRFNMQESNLISWATKYGLAQPTGYDDRPLTSTDFGGGDDVSRAEKASVTIGTQHATAEARAAAERQAAAELLLEAQVQQEIASMGL
jgi:hypothetical protein